MIDRDFKDFNLPSVLDESVNLMRLEWRFRRLEQNSLENSRPPIFRPYIFDVPSQGKILSTVGRSMTFPRIDQTLARTTLPAITYPLGSDLFHLTSRRLFVSVKYWASFCHVSLFLADCFLLENSAITIAYLKI